MSDNVATKLKNIRLKRLEVSSETIIDLLVFYVLIPAFLFTVFLTPLNKSFALYTAHPTLITVYFSNFAHAGVSHFINNLTSYILIVTLILMLQKMLKIRTRKEFYYDMVFIYLVVPFVVSAYSILKYPGNATNAFLGFSGVVSSLSGYLVALIFVYIYTKLGLKLTKLNYILCSVIFFNLIILVNFKYLGVDGYTAPLLFLILFCVLSAREDVTRIFSFTSFYINNTRLKNVYVEYVFFTLVILLVGLVILLMVMLWLAMFPDNLRTESGSTVNIIGHYLGYCVGILTPWFIHLIQLCLPQTYPVISLRKS